ncbi:Hypothetical predicted protein [Cloeon dipterum]|uniref:Uncharacterized protein n=1 Tax=Cloeon dipterum TaxID=197152 RepID=A0A8S1DP37_9INSE|nr:Hypothetical predicted protein [Cloeon dipterum]
MDSEDACTGEGCTEKKEYGNYCIDCYILYEFPIEDSPPPDERNSEQTGDQLAKNETLAAVNVAVDEPQVEQTARQVPRANENVGVASPPEHPNILEQESTSVNNTSDFGVCPASEGISESQSAEIQEDLLDWIIWICELSGRDQTS